MPMILPKKIQMPEVSITADQAMLALDAYRNEFPLFRIWSSHPTQWVVERTESAPLNPDWVLAAQQKITVEHFVFESREAADTFVQLKAMCKALETLNVDPV